MKFFGKEWSWNSFFSGSIIDSDRVTYPIYSQEIIGSKEPIYVDCNNLKDVYDSIPHLKLVIDLNAQMLSNGIWQHYRDGELLESSELLDKLNQPNVLQGGKDFLVNWSVELDIYGNSFVYGNKGLASRELQYMWCLPSANMVLEPTGKIYKQDSLDGIIKGYVLHNGEDRENYSNEEIIPFKNVGNGVLLGRSNVITLKQQISNIKYAYESRNVAIVNRGVQGILSAMKPGAASNSPIPTMHFDEKKKAEEKLQKEYGTGKGQNRLAMTTLDVKYTDLSAKVKDLMLFEEVQDDFKVIIDAYGSNVHLFGVSDSTFNNVAAAEKQVYQNTIIPRANMLAGKLNKFLELPEGEEIKLSYSHLPSMQEDEKSRADVDKVVVEALNKAYNDKVISGQEYRDNLPSSYKLDTSVNYESINANSNEQGEEN